MAKVRSGFARPGERLPRGTRRPKPVTQKRKRGVIPTNYRVPDGRASLSEQFQKLDEALRPYRKFRSKPRRCSSQRLVAAENDLSAVGSAIARVRRLIGKLRNGTPLREVNFLLAGVPLPAGSRSFDTRCRAVLSAFRLLRSLKRREGVARRHVSALKTIDTPQAMARGRRPVPHQTVTNGFFQYYDSKPAPLSADMDREREDLISSAALLLDVDARMNPVRISKAEVVSVFQMYAKRNTAAGSSGLSYKAIARAIRDHPVFAEGIAKFGTSTLQDLAAEASATDPPSCPPFLPEFPSELLETVIVLLPKKSPDSRRPQDWRPVSLSECLRKGLAEIVRRKVSKFLNVPKPCGQLRYLTENYVAHCLSDGGSIDTACRMVRMLVERAAASASACVLVSTDLSNAFGSVDLDTVFPILYRVYRVDIGAAATVAYTAKYRTQKLKPLEAKMAEVGIAQGMPDSGDVYGLAGGVPAIAADPDSNEVVHSSYHDDQNSVIIRPTLEQAIEDARSWSDRLQRGNRLLNLYPNPEKSCVVVLDFTRRSKKGFAELRLPTARQWQNPIKMCPRGGVPVAVPLLSVKPVGVAPVVPKFTSLGMAVVPMTTRDFRRWGISVPRPLTDGTGAPMSLGRAVSAAISDLSSSAAFLELALRPRVQWVNKRLDATRALLVTCSIRSSNELSEADQALRVCARSGLKGVGGVHGNSLPSAVLHLACASGGLGLRSMLESFVAIGIRNLRDVLIAKDGGNAGKRWAKRETIDRIMTLKGLRESGRRLLKAPLRDVGEEFLTVPIRDLKVVIPATLIRECLQTDRPITQCAVNGSMGLCTVASDLTCLATAGGRLIWLTPDEPSGIELLDRKVEKASKLGPIVQAIGLHAGHSPKGRQLHGYIRKFVERCKKGRPAHSSKTLTSTTGERMFDLSVFIHANVKARAIPITPRLQAHVKGRHSKVCLACLRTVDVGTMAAQHVLEGLPVGGVTGCCPSVKAAALRRHNSVARALARAIVRSSRQSSESAFEVPVGSRRVDAFVKFGLDVVVAEVSVTNQDRVRTLKKGQLHLNTELVRRELETEQGGPFPSHEAFVAWVWRNLGSDAVLFCVSLDSAKGINVAVAVGVGAVSARNFPIPPGLQSKSLKPSFWVKLLDRHLTPVLRGAMEGRVSPLRLVGFVTRSAEAGVRQWTAGLRFSFLSSILRFARKDPPWTPVDVEGPDAKRVAEEAGLGWPDEPLDPCPVSPTALQVRSCLALFDTKGCAYPETAKSFRAVASRNIPPCVGAAVILQTGEIYRAWRAGVKRNAHLQ